jgi:hypothetical protein
MFELNYEAQHYGTLKRCMWKGGFWGQRYQQSLIFNFNTFIKTF